MLTWLATKGISNESRCLSENPADIAPQARESRHTWRESHGATGCRAVERCVHGRHARELAGEKQSRGPAFIKVAKSILYPIEAVELFEAQMLSIIGEGVR